MSKNVVEPERSQLKKRRRVACWISKYTRAQSHASARALTHALTVHTHAREYVILFAFAMQQWFRELSPILCCWLSYCVLSHTSDRNLLGGEYFKNSVQCDLLRIRTVHFCQTTRRHIPEGCIHYIPHSQFRRPHTKISVFACYFQVPVSLPFATDDGTHSGCS